MDELREAHRGVPRPRPDAPSVAATLQAAYEAVMAGSGAPEDRAAT